MSKLKMMQYSLLCTTLIGTALFAGVSFDIVPPLYAALYVLVALIPQVLAFIIQLGAVKEKYAAYKAACQAYQSLQKHKEVPQKGFLLALRDDFHLIAARKGRGINPNRAGPVIVFS